MAATALLCTGGEFHDFAEVTERLWARLVAAGLETTTTVGMPYAQELDSADLLVTYTDELTITEEQLTALTRWLKAGGRWFAMHGSNAPRLPLTEPDRSYLDLLGSRFRSHPAPLRLRLRPLPPAGELGEVITSVEVWDELYLMDLSSDIEALAVAESLDGSAEHVSIYRRTHGRGQVLYLALGDLADPDRADPDAPDGPWEQPEFGRLIEALVGYLLQGRSPVG